MSIGSWIIGASPALYWPLADLAGLVAADASGNGRNGAYSASATLNQPGAEVGTIGAAAPSAIDGFVTRAVLATGHPACTMMYWAAFASLNGPNFGFMRQVGPNRGWELAPGGAGSYGANCRTEIVRQGVGITLMNTDLAQDQFWHQHVVTYDGTSTYIYYRDGVQQATIAPGAPNNLTVADSIYANAPDPGFYAHFAQWTSVLTAAQVLAAYQARGTLNTPPWVTGQGVVNPLIFTDLTALQATCDAILAAVRKTYS